MGTLSKAAGLSGGFIATSRAFADLLVNRARSFVFSTAPPPALCHAATAALDLIRSDDGAALRDTLRQNIDTLTNSLSGCGVSPQSVPAASCRSPILPIILGDNQAALSASQALEQAGFLVPAIRYPTVPRDTARLRISLSSAHPTAAVQALALTLGREASPRPPAGKTPPRQD